MLAEPATMPPLVNYPGESAIRLRFSLDSTPRLAAGSRVLLAGSYGGEAGHFARRGAGEVSAIRAPGDGIPYLTDANGYSLYAFDAETSDWPDIGQFDLVTMWEVLEHLSVEPTRFLFNAIKAAKIGGTVSLTTPNVLWHVLTIDHLFGGNATSLRLQHHIPYATHWRLWSPSEVAECFRAMGCEVTASTTFMHEKPYPTLKSWLMVRALEFLRRNSGNGDCTVGQHLLVNAKKVSEPLEVYKPNWLHPQTKHTEI
jgi:2-polyprenyl-3-methyl-5-hydroxy-6-metoxy-1,4-benzoquinol methylase